MAYDLAAFKKRLQNELGGKKADPDEFKPPKNITDTIKYRFYILPPYVAGDTVISNGSEIKASADMPNFYMTHSQHWFQDKPYSCPRMQNNEECPACTQGFELFKTTPKTQENAELRKNITKTWMPSTYYIVNILFANSTTNPEELRGKVKYYKAPKSLFDAWVKCIMNEQDNEEDEEPSGIFFDENDALLFQLEINKQGTMNDYKRSKFVSSKKTAIAADKKAIKEILNKRIFLHDKIEPADIQKLKAITATLLNGDDGDDGGDGFTHEEVKTKPTTKTSSKPAPKSVLDEEAPFEDDEPKVMNAKPKTEEVKKKPKPEPAPAPDADDDDDEIARLMAQMDD